MKNRPEIVVRLALATGLLPILTVIVCALWSVQIGAVPRCWPFTDGCMSISAACRTPPVLYAFRTTMLPDCVLLVLYWWFNDRWLAEVVAEKPRTRRWIWVLATVGSLFLISYVLFLGTDGPVYTFLRRIGVYVFFGATGIAELINAWVTRHVGFRRGARLQLTVVGLLLLLGPLNLLLKATLAEPDRMENIIEWWFGLLLFSYYLINAWRWHRDRPVLLQNR